MTPEWGFNKPPCALSGAAHRWEQASSAVELLLVAWYSLMIHSSRYMSALRYTYHPPNHSAQWWWSPPLLIVTLECSFSDGCTKKRVGALD